MNAPLNVEGRLLREDRMSFLMGDRFEDSPAWQTAAQLAEKAIALSADPVFSTYSRLTHRLEDAALGLSSRIASLAEFQSEPERQKVLASARASAAESRSLLVILSRLPISGQDPRVAEMQSLSVRVAAELRGSHGATTHRPAIADDREQARSEKRALFEELRRMSAGEIQQL